MPEPINLTPEEIAALQADNQTLRKTNAELTQKSATRKARITELEASATALQAKATEAEARIRQLTIDGPVNDLCESISVAPQALRSALESEYQIEMRDGVLTLLNPSDSKPVMQDGKAVPFTPDAVKALLLGSKDESKLKLYRAVLIASRSSGAASPNPISRKASTQTKPRIQFGLR
jgi:chromosome segregation ATPase